MTVHETALRADADGGRLSALCRSVEAALGNRDERHTEAVDTLSVEVVRRIAAEASHLPAGPECRRLVALEGWVKRSQACRPDDPRFPSTAAGLLAAARQLRG